MTDHVNGSTVPSLQGRPPFPSFVDNSMRSDFLLCPRKWMYAYLFNLAPITPSVHLHAGGAFARGLEVARKAFYQEQLAEGESKRRGLEATIQAYGNFLAPPTKQGDKSLDNVIRALDSYFLRYPLGKDPIVPFKAANGKLMIEFSFSIPTEVHRPWCTSCEKPTLTHFGRCQRCNQPLDLILYSGRCDMIGKLYESLFVTDEKTTTQLGEQWATQWDLESQFTGYIFAAQQHGFPVAGALIRGVGLLKTKISHAEAQVYRKAWEIERWWKQLHKDVQRMVDAYIKFDFDLALSKHACAAFGGCAFKILTQSEEPERWMNQYRIRKWNPLEKDFGEKLLDNPGLQQTPGDDLEIDFEKLM